MPGPITPKPTSQPRRLNPNVGRFSIGGFVGFCCVFAAAAWLIDTDPKSTPARTMTSAWDKDEFTQRQDDSNLTIPAPFSNESPPSDARNPDYFNRHMRTPWVYRRAVTLTEAQSQMNQRQTAQQERVAMNEDRKRAAAARQNDAKRRQNEIDRFSESRRFAAGTLRSGDETPRGRSAERNVPLERGRSMSTASSYSASSDDSF